MSQQNSEQEVVRLTEAWTDAELHGDRASLENLLADDFVGVGPLGFQLTKAQWLARHQSGDMQYTAHTLDEIKVRVYAEAAIVIGRLTQEATYQNNPINVQMRATLVFVRQEEQQEQQKQWHLAGLHFCNIGQPPAFARA